MVANDNFPVLIPAPYSLADINKININININIKIKNIK